MMCRDCGRLDGLKTITDKKEAICEHCLKFQDGCKHSRTKVYKDFTDGTVYTICRNCSYRQEL